MIRSSALRSSATQLDFDQARDTMVEGQVKPNNVVNPVLIEAFRNIKREDFVRLNDRALAYIEKDIHLGRDRYLLAPTSQARLLEAANITQNDFVLDVGCGSGYSSVLIAHLANGGVALESDPELARQARHNLNSYGFDRFEVKTGDFQRGWQRSAPYSVIVINGMVADIPDALTEQLMEGGRLVTFQMEGNIGRAVMLIKIGGECTKRILFDCSAPWLDGFEPKPEFQF